jgi:hypothetical protein
MIIYKAERVDERRRGSAIWMNERNKEHPEKRSDKYEVQKNMYEIQLAS